MPMLPRLLILSLSVLLAACAGTGEVKRINPPDVSVQRLKITPGSDARIDVRVHNHSDVEMEFNGFDLSLRLGTSAPITLPASGAIDITPHSAELLSLSIPFNQVPPDALARLMQGEMVAYALFGAIDSSAPKRQRYDVSFEARLSAVPGVPGEYR